MSTTDLAPSQPPIEASDATGDACPSHDIITVVRDPEHSLGQGETVLTLTDQQLRDLPSILDNSLRLVQTARHCWLAR
ncbi:hypothetical protein CCR82_09050 [Halochromatium salexigens]|uniref:Uncharacterized protein n=1 Tax=Halochromatium salexigens TaxID=49447 RepID=A0AAJ0UFT0_HALSE|nr:hypothetical protein [Halochromatium salexigens]